MTEPLDDTQQLAAQSGERNLLVIAPPGCGKTELLAMRADALISRLHRGQKILALTFTNRAKANLSHRLRTLLGSERFRRHVAVRNFHGHAAEVVLAHGRTLNLPVDELTMPTSGTQRKALQAFSSDSGANKAAGDVLAQVKRTAIGDDEVIDALDAAGDALAKRVELDRVANNQLHYEDLLRHCQRLLSVNEIANLYRQHYGAVLVDEFQDLSPQQLSIVLATCEGWRTFAGDPLQGIYSWAGAQPKKIEAELRGLCGAPTQLTISYRSSPAVLRLFNGIASQLGAEPLRAFDPSAWPDGGAAVALELATLQKEAASLVAICTQIVEADPSASVGIITRSGWRRSAIDAAFARTADELPCRRWDLAVEDPEILDRVRTAIVTMPPSIAFDEACEKIVMAIDPSDVDTIEQIVDAFVQLQSSGANSPRAALKQFRPVDVNEPIGPGVHLLNAHVGKGQQFDWVVVPGLEEKHIPDRRSSQGAALAEEHRVLLVMISRARHGVVVTKVTTLDGKFGPYASTPSRWWSDLASTATMTSAMLKAHLDKHYPKTF
jgi:DNA helicase-2/ATP-dependent DNA helicase PcrA